MLGPQIHFGVGLDIVLETNKCKFGCHLTDGTLPQLDRLDRARWLRLNNDGRTGVTPVVPKVDLPVRISAVPSGPLDIDVALPHPRGD